MLYQDHHHVHDAAASLRRKNPTPDNPPLTEKLPDTKGIHPQNQKKPNNRASPNPADGVKQLALTFGTLLSSQGADAHQSEPFGSSWGSSRNVTRLVSRCQTSI